MSRLPNGEGRAFEGEIAGPELGQIYSRGKGMFEGSPTRNEVASPSQIILWWERRRALYNVAVGLVGFASVAVLLTVGPKVVGAQEPLFSPFFLFLGILIYAVGANICYTAGWIFELLLRKRGRQNTEKFANAAFKAGLGFSCVITSLPIWFVLVLWISHLR
ncbi:MAG TPA: hypothetical protein VKH81_15985 [Candidatus Angelobacter sp.]|nr:hypothetical protein [Candidatus Angelobacter sp.]